MRSPSVVYRAERGSAIAEPPSAIVFDSTVVKQQLAAQAEQHGRSMETEVRDILTRAAQRPHVGLALMQAARKAGGIDDLPVPERADTARVADLG